MPATKAARDKAEATRLHSLIVRARGVCEACGGTQNLQCAHIVSRRYSHTRTRVDNAFCLCAKDHMHYTEWPVEFAAFVTEKIGGERYRELKAAARQSGKVDWADERARLAAIWHDIEMAA